jgi:signal transduction histidine kinase
MDSQPCATRAVIADAAGTLLSAACDLWGWLGCETPRHRPAMLADVQAALAPGMVIQPLAMDDGTTLHLIVRPPPQAGEPPAQAADTEALIRENRLLRETLDAVDGSIVVHDGELRFRLANKGYHDLYPHLPPDHETAGMHFSDMLRASIAAGVYSDPRALTDTEAYVAERVAQMSRRVDSVSNVYRASAKRWSQVRTRWTPSGNRVALRVDITESKRLEEELVRNQRVKTVGRIAGGVAHHFNNLLTVICGNLDLLLQQPDLSARSLDLAERALVGAEQGGKLTRQLLTFAQRDISRPRRIDINPFLDGMAALLHSVLGSTVALEMRQDGRKAAVNVDPAKLETAMVNLILNARDAIAGRPGGRVEIRTALQQQQGGLFRVIAVTDNGAGMTPDVAAEAFEPFFTTRHPSAASGLGLSEVHGFATGAGGDARIASRPGEGTTVEMLLPVVE